VDKQLEQEVQEEFLGDNLPVNLVSEIAFNGLKKSLESRL
jgi:hypothetical protein